jgi:hypothetical protein
MSWFKRKKPEYEIITNEVPMSTVYRWYLYDTALTENVNELAERIGLTPVSPEGESKECEDSEERLAYVEPLYPFLDSISDLSAQVLTHIHIKEAEENGEDIEELMDKLDSMGNVYKAIALSTLMGAFSIALNLGLIEHDTINMTTAYLGDKNGQ